MRAVAGILALLVAMVAPAADTYISTTGTNSGVCGSGAPCASVTYALSQMSDGDTMYVADGTYTDTVTKATYCDIAGPFPTSIAISTSNGAPDCSTTGCTIRATNITDPPSVVFQSTHYGLWVRDLDNWTIQGFQFESQGAGKICAAGDITIEDSVFRVNAAGTYSNVTGLSFCGEYQSNGPCVKAFLPRGTRKSNFVVRNVTVTQDVVKCDVEYVDNYLGAEWDTINFYNVTDVLVEDSEFLAGTDGITMSYAEDLTFRRNRIAGWSGHGFSMVYGTTGLLFENNIVGGLHECAATCSGDATVTCFPAAACTAVNVPHSYCTGNGTCSPSHGYWCCVGGTLGLDDDNCAQAPTGFDVYELNDATIRNNSFVGHGYMLQQMWGGIYQGTSGITSTQCGFCAGPGNPDYLDACDSHDDCVATCSPWGNYENCQCTGQICDRTNIRIYNNIVYDLSSVASPNGYYIVDRGCSGGCTTSNITHDGNLYYGDPGEWRVSNGLVWPYVVDTLAEWQAIRDDNATALSYYAQDPDPTSSDSEPTFTALSTGDYTPASGSSPQVDAGKTGTDGNGISYCANEDFNQNSRSDGSCDIGAFEFGGGILTVVN